MSAVLLPQGLALDGPSVGERVWENVGGATPPTFPGYLSGIQKLYGLFFLTKEQYLQVKG